MFHNLPNSNNEVIDIVYEIRWKNIVELGRLQMTVCRLHIASWIPKAYKHSLILFNTACA